MCESCYTYCEHCGKLIVGEDISFCKKCRESVKGKTSRWFVAS